MERSTAAQAAGVFLVTLAAGLPLAIRAGDWLAGDDPPAPPPAQGQHIESRLGEAPAAERPVPGGWSGEREPDAVTSAAATAPPPVPPVADAGEAAGPAHPAEDLPSPPVPTPISEETAGPTAAPTTDPTTTGPPPPSPVATDVDDAGAPPGD